MLQKLLVGASLSSSAAAGTWTEHANKSLTCSAGEYKGDLGHFDKAAASCLAAAEARADVNYALWRADTGDCYICAITDRGDPSNWKYADSASSTSFAGAGVLPPAPAPTPAPGADGNCRIHTDAASTASAFAWRNAYTPLQQQPLQQQHATVSGGEDDDPLGRFDTHEYGICSAGKGPYAYSDKTSSVAQCAAKCLELNCTCFDISCPYHGAADCACPHVPAVTPAPSATKVACVGDSITAGYLSSW